MPIYNHEFMFGYCLYILACKTFFFSSLKLTSKNIIRIGINYFFSKKAPKICRL